VSDNLFYSLFIFKVRLLSQTLFCSLKILFERSSTMVGLEIVMNLDTLEIFDVIDHDKDGNSEQEPTTIQLSLFDSMTCI